ncbi:MAG: hypothetical protein MUP76_00315 [Acidimicrobiia bacterium]|nr:hypothetical protein [Acidimicrobiia bacterium]
MSTNRNRIVAGILALVLAVGLAACGNDDGPSSTVPGGTEMTEPAGS